MTSNMTFPDIDNFEMNDQYFEEIFPDIWLMDDHRWAYYVWEIAASRNSRRAPFALLHLDHHWDGVNDFNDVSAADRFAAIKDIDDIYVLVSDNDYIRKDSFIAPAIIRGLVDEVHFFCKQNNTERGLYAPFLKAYKARQFMHESIESLLSQPISKRTIFDIDLDLFNNSEMWAEGDLWAEEEICRFLSACSSMIQSSSAVTAAMSFGYSGTGRDTRYLTELFVSFMGTLRG